MSSGGAEIHISSTSKPALDVYKRQGVDDQTEEQAKEMREAEETALAMLPADLSEVWRK